MKRAQGKSTKEMTYQDSVYGAVAESDLIWDKI